MYPSIKTPLSIYVLFHQDSDEGRALAHSLHDWFRLKTDDGERSESSLPVWFRSVLLVDEAEPPEPRVSPDIDRDGAELSIVVVRADRYMVVDFDWYQALFSLCGQVEQRATRSVNLATRAQLVGLCYFEDVFPPSFGRDPRPDDDDYPETVPGRRLTGEALRAMRRHTSDPDRAPMRVLIGGKTNGSSGWLPGIADEMLHALRSGQLPVVIGGCAGVLAGYLRDPSAAWPSELTFEHRLREAKFAELCVIPEDDGARRDYEELWRKLPAYCDWLAGQGQGLSFPEGTRHLLVELLECRSPTRIVQQVLALAEVVSAWKSRATD